VTFLCLCHIMFMMNINIDRVLNLAMAPVYGEVMVDESIDNILNQYRPLVKHIAKRAYFSSSALDLQDLYQVGDMAVLRAIKGYDPSSGKNIKSFVTNSIRNAIFNEAASFLGPITVDFRTTTQASNACKLHEKGKTDVEIAAILTAKYGRNFDADHVRDLRIAYSRRQYSDVQDDSVVSEIDDDITIQDILESVIKDNVDRILVNDRILGFKSIDDLSKQLSMSRKVLYEREANLKHRIRQAIKDAV
jgi:RNA polymerase sigma factor (sigma-70 family)